MKAFILAASGLMLSGCSMPGQLSRVAVEHNALVARTTDEMMLTNILRARQREPMHFTSLSALHGNISLSGEADLTAAFPTGALATTHDPKGAVLGDTATSAANTFTPVLKGVVSTNPSFDLAVDDSQQFYQGFLDPIKPKTIAHFLDDGWPPEMLTYLLVSRFDLIAKHTVYANGKAASEAAEGDDAAALTAVAKETVVNGPVIARKGQVLRSLVNDADPAGADFYKFKNFVSCFHLHATSVKREDVPLMPVPTMTSMVDIEKLDGKSFDVDQPTKMLVRKGGQDDALELVAASDADVGAPSGICSKDVLIGPAAAIQDARKFHFTLTGALPGPTTIRSGVVLPHLTKRRASTS